MEVLHYTQENVYNELQINYSTYLMIKKGDQDKQETLVPVTESTNPLLKYIFTKESEDYPINSIIWTNHYYSYFAHRQLDNYVSSTEFKLLMNSSDKKRVLSTIKGWLLNERTSDCLIQLLEAFPHHLKFETTAEADNYTYVLLDMLSKFTYSPRIDYTQSLSAKLFKKKYHQAYFTKLNQYTPYVIINEQIMDLPDIRWNCVLTAMCLTYDEEMKNEEYDSPILTELYYVISRKELSDLAELNYILFFNGKDVPIEKLFKKGDNYTNFIMSLSFVEETTGYKTVIKKYNNLIGNYLINRFDETLKEKFGDKEFSIIYANLKELAGIHYDMDGDEAHRKLMDTICKYLGATKNFEHLINKHFNLGHDYMKICRNWGLVLDADKSTVSYALRD